LTTNLLADAEPLRIRIAAAARLTRDADLLMDHIRGPLLRLPAATMKRVGRGLSELLGITD
jgi:hypothetical protein